MRQVTSFIASECLRFARDCGHLAGGTEELNPLALDECEVIANYLRQRAG